jgi:hypothetical protein
VDGPEPYVKTSAIVAAALAQFYVKTRYYNEKDQNTNVHSSFSMRNQFRLFGGVFTPSGIFHRFPLIYDTLCDAGINFELYSPVLDGLTVQLPTTTINANYYQIRRDEKIFDGNTPISRLNEKSGSIMSSSIEGERLSRPSGLSDSRVAQC